MPSSSTYGEYPLSRIPRRALRASIFFTRSSSPAIVISPRLRACSITVIEFSTSSGIRRMSAPALYAANGISFFSRPLSLATPCILRASVQMIPLKPSFSLNNPVTIGLEIEEGVPDGSRAGMFRWATITISTPSGIRRLKGYISSVSNLV